MKNKAVIFSLFSGIGFLDLGFEMAGLPVVYVSDIERPFLEAYKYSRQNLHLSQPRYGYYEGGVNDLLEGKQSELFSGCVPGELFSSYVKDAKSKGEIVGFIAGPPCPDFSVGGKNMGSTGKNGRLTASYFSLISQHKPDFFLFENVKGLWRTKKHRAFFEEMKNKVHQEGYITTEKLINSLSYGAPQYRERIILLGFKRELLEKLGYEIKKDEVSLPDNMFPWNKFAKYDAEKVLKMKWPLTSPFMENSQLPCPEGLIKELTVEYWFQKNKVNTHPNSQHVFKPKAGLKKFTTVQEGDDSKKSYKRLHRWRYSPTAAYGNNEVHLHPYKSRRITIAEALSIQSLPEGFFLPPSMTLTDMFKSVGNGVPFLAANSIAKSIISYMEGK